MMSRVNKTSLTFSATHLTAFVLTVIFINRSPDPQAPLVWVFFAIVDFPVSLLYLLPIGNYSHEVDTAATAVMSQILYLPHLIHGVLGTIWWYFLPRAILRLAARVGQHRNP